MIAQEETRHLSHLLDNSVGKIAPDEWTVSLDNDPVCTAIFYDRFLLAERMELHACIHQ